MNNFLIAFEERKAVTKDKIEIYREVLETEVFPILENYFRAKRKHDYFDSLGETQPR